MIQTRALVFAPNFDCLILMKLMVPILCMLCRVRVNHRAAEEAVAWHRPAAAAAVSPSIQAAHPCRPCHQPEAVEAASVDPRMTSPHRRLGAGEPLVVHLGVEEAP